MKIIKNSLCVCLALISFQTSAIDFKECRIGADNGGEKLKAECATLSVPENRENTSRLIDLNIALIKSKATKKQADPVIMLAGGPGQSAVETYVSVAYAFIGILKDRDVVLVDQRGTGKSNPLKCDFDKSVQEKLLKDPDLLYPELEKCVSNLDADTRYYTTSESIRDLEDVRKAMNIEKWNLIGVSYGTRKALTYMKMFPDSIRSVILDGVVPQQEALASSHEHNLITALRKQFDQCSEQQACQETFGDVEQQMWELLAKIDEEKPTIRLQNFINGDYDEVKLTKESIAIAIRMFSYSASSMHLLPLMINKANNGQLETIAAQANMINSMMQQSMTNVEFSILCAEDMPFYPDTIESKEQTIFGEDFLEQTKKTCDYWPHMRVDPSFKDPVNSDLPVLLLSGELDPVTPPSFAETTMETLTKAQHLVAKGQGHNVFPLGCMPDIITDFFASPESELDTECMDDFNYTPFFINMMGPKQ